MVGYIIFGVAVVIVVSLVAFFLTRFMKGSIKLHLQGTSFQSGDTIKGNFELHTKKQIQCNRLQVELIGEKITKTRNNDGETDSDTHEIFRNGVTLENQTEFAAGFRQKYEFEIPTPDNSQPDFMNSSLGQTISSALSMISNRQVRILWKVEARLDTKGVDLSDSEKVNINGFS